jgi:DNA-directed RNA polymerase subunit RPC12/RpoP
MAKTVEYRRNTPTANIRTHPKGNNPEGAFLLSNGGNQMAKLQIDLKCPNCHRKFKQKVEEMHPGRSRRCPYCKTMIEFTGDDGREVQKAVDNLERALKRMSRIIKVKL